MEPVQGEGNPGIQLSKDFYKCVREVTQKLNIPLCNRFSSSRY